MDRAPQKLVGSVMASRRRFAAARCLCALAACALGACAPAIGDECKTSLDCSSQGSRLCDRTQPRGYCTLRGCEQGTCPDESVCVKFRPEAERLSTTWCMAKCDSDDDCRSDDGYRCTEAEDFSSADVPEAEILGRPDQRFCSAALAPTAPPDEGPRESAGGDAAAERVEER
jgi:hypothetical protein